jgi:FkbM family methyltransferase
MIKEFIPKDGDFVIDAGAGVGEYTMVASVEVGEKGNVIAIEASSEPFRYLSKNAKLNPNKNIIALHAALGQKSGRLKMFRPAGTSFVDSINKSWSGSTVSYYVKSVTVDSLVKKFGIKKLDLIKLDIEGAELLALRGAMKTIEKMKPKIIIETHSKELHQDVLKFLRRSSYKIDLEKIKFENPFIAIVYASSKD